MKRLENNLILVIIMLSAMTGFVCLVDDMAPLIVYLSIATAGSIFLKINSYLILLAFVVYIVGAVVAQLIGADWFYHDMPDKLNIDWMLINLFGALVFVIPFCCGAGISRLFEWLKKRAESDEENGRQAGT